MGKKKASPAEDIVDVVGLMPWWGGVLLAAIAYVVLHRFAAPVASGPVHNTAQIVGMVRGTLVSELAWWGQFIVPLFFLLGALNSFVRRRRRAALVTDVASGDVSALNAMSWREFEIMVGEAFRLQGYTVTEIGGGGADGGVDLSLRKGNEVFLVQCKQWRALKVDVRVVRELFGLMAAKGAAGAFVVTSGRFTSDAEAFAEGRNIRLIDGARLHGLTRRARKVNQRST